MTAEQSQTAAHRTQVDGGNLAGAPASRPNDPGNSTESAPPMSRLALVILSVAWAGWVVFLIVMMMSVRGARGG